MPKEWCVNSDIFLIKQIRREKQSTDVGSRGIITDWNGSWKTNRTEIEKSNKIKTKNYSRRVNNFEYCIDLQVSGQ